MYQKSLTTISNILDAAQTTFLLNNYDDITMTGIAEVAGVTKGAIYHHFESKQQLFLKMMTVYLEHLRDELATAVSLPIPARERLTKLTCLYLSKSLHEQKVIQLVRRDNGRFKGTDRDQLILAYQAALPNPIETIIADGIAEGTIINDDPRLLAWQYVAIVEVSLSDYARQRFNNPQKMAEYLTRIFFEGVAANSG